MSKTKAPQRLSIQAHRKALELVDAGIISDMLDGVLPDMAQAYFSSREFFELSVTDRQNALFDYLELTKLLVKMQRGE